MVLNLDLNGPPPSENAGGSVDLSLRIRLPWETGTHQIQVTNRNESVDDDVVICSPRGFLEAREKARRNHQVIEAIDEGSDFQRRHSDSGTCNSKTWEKSLVVMQSIIFGTLNTIDFYLFKRNLLVVPPPRPNIFCCPVCMGQFREETSTKCGHIFCKECIYSVIAVQGKCPTCRQKIKVMDTFRVYLPAAD
ncbi:hypothetical protein NMG60_11031850 [Bertholletia excelsa]